MKHPAQKKQPWNSLNQKGAAMIEGMLALGLLILSVVMAIDVIWISYVTFATNNVLSNTSRDAAVIPETQRTISAIQNLITNKLKAYSINIPNPSANISVKCFFNGDTNCCSDRICSSASATLTGGSVVQITINNVPAGFIIFKTSIKPTVIRQIERVD